MYSHYSSNLIYNASHFLMFLKIMSFRNNLENWTILKEFGEINSRHIYKEGLMSMTVVTACQVMPRNVLSLLCGPIHLFISTTLGNIRIIIIPLR